MSEVSIRDLRHHGGEIVERARAGERVVITREGRPVAELRAIQEPELTGAALLERWRHVPAVDPVRWREDLDEIVDARL